MDIGKTFSYVFEDERWISKVLIGGLVFIVPILNFAVFGYTLKVAQNVAQGNSRPLPEWGGEFGDHFMRGLYWVVIQLVYLLPAILLYGIFACVLVGAGSAASENGSDAAGAIGTLGVCLLPLVFLLFLVGGVLAYGGIARFAATNSLSEAFKFAEVIALVRNNLGDWIMLLLVIILSGIVAQLGFIACGVGVLFTSFYAQCVNGHALGQLIAKFGLLGNPYATQQVPPVDYNPPMS
ncbi:MAG TPA: DUF4013 domain-containing protein [Roseiflexaceae bacterium]|nr:DUF4013 domain-containing protein [Roseiflexaceae bacterium]